MADSHPPLPPPIPPSSSPAKPAWQQPWVFAVGGTVGLAILVIVLMNLVDGSKPSGNQKGAATAKIGQNRTVPPKRTKEEQEADLERLVQDRVNEALLKVEQERLAALKAVAEKLAATEAAAKEAAAENLAATEAAAKEAAAKEAAAKEAAAKETAAKETAAKEAAAKEAAAKEAAAKEAAAKEAASTEAAAKKAIEDGTELATVNLTGTWKSTRTGTLFRIEDNGSTLAVSLLKSDEMSFFKGAFQRQGISLTSSVWECRFKKFAKGETLKGDSKAYVRRSNTIKLRVPYYYYDKNGKVQRKTTAQTTWVRQEMKR